MLDKTIPFEIHITTENLSLQREKDFVDFCCRHQAKPLLIKLLQGNCINQPMFSKVVYCQMLETVVEIASQLTSELNTEGFSSRRLKIEVPSEFAIMFYTLSSTFEKYFEWHGKINYIQAEKLLEVCEKHKAHLSLNSLKNETGTRFITLREFGTQSIFENRVAALISALAKDNWNIIKQQSEYCIYDNNKLLDKGWLPV